MVWSVRIRRDPRSMRRWIASECAYRARGGICLLGRGVAREGRGRGGSFWWWVGCGEVGRGGSACAIDSREMRNLDRGM
jgi:hypothetical protein